MKSHWMFIGAALLLVLALAPTALAQDEPGPSEIPAKLAAQAKKTFAQKLPYFIWAEKPASKPREVKLFYAVNPDVKAPEAHTVMKLVRRVPSGMMVPWTGTTQGISPPVPGGRDFLGKAAASINLIDALDVIDAKGNVQPMPENAKPISNKVTVQLTFQ